MSLRLRMGVSLRLRMGGELALEDDDREFFWVLVGERFYYLSYCSGNNKKFPPHTRDTQCRQGGRRCHVAQCGVCARLDYTSLQVNIICVGPLGPSRPSTARRLDSVEKRGEVEAGKLEGAAEAALNFLMSRHGV